MATAQLEALVQHLRTAAAHGPVGALSDAQLLARFAATRDEAAFAALVQRHGAMVLAVCRRQLRDWHAAQDAFQATFLVLARKAGTLAQPALLARWLHGVACRTAARARTDAARRREREGQAQTREADKPDESLIWRELRPVLDEEIARLPARQAAAVVLCYLEERTNAEAARRLGCSRGTVATLLARARARLRKRLASRGLSLPAGLIGAAGVPLALTGSTARAAAVFAAQGTSAVVPLSASAAALAEGVLRTMMVNKFKLVAATVLLLTLVGVGARWIGHRATAQEPVTAQAVPTTREGDSPAPTLRRTDPQTRINATCRTTNFLVTAPSQKIAEQIGKTAERARKAQALLWLGKELPSWPKPCVIRAKVHEDEGGMGHATTFQFEDGRVISMRMELEAPMKRLLNDAIPHEVTHTVLASWYGRGIPRWADEGAATLAESPAMHRRQEMVLRKLVAEGRLMPLRRLLAMREYPQNAGEIPVMYAEGYSLTRFLVQNYSHEKFLAFVVEGDKSTWNKAVQKYYGYRTVELLEAAWLARLRNEPQASSPASDREAADPVQKNVAGESKALARLRLPVGTAPEQAVVKLADGQFSVWRQRQFYLARTSNNGGRPFTYFEQTTSTFCQQYPLRGTRVYDAHGKQIEAKRLPKLFKNEKRVLVAVDGRPVDPLHLRLYKEDTLVVVLPGTQGMYFTVPPQPVPGVGKPPPPAPFAAPAPVAPPAVVPAVPATPPAVAPPQPVPAPVYNTPAP